MGTHRLRDHLLQDEISQTAYHSSYQAHYTTIIVTYATAMQSGKCISPPCLQH